MGSGQSALNHSFLLVRSEQLDAIGSQLSDVPGGPAMTLDGAGAFENAFAEQKAKRQLEIVAWGPHGEDLLATDLDQQWLFADEVVAATLTEGA